MLVPLNSDDVAALSASFWVCVERSGDCWNWTGDAPGGYGYLWLPGVSGRLRETAAHRLAWMLSSGYRIPSGRLICHHCDNPLCVRPSHLYCGTRKDNRRDTSSRGSRAKQLAEGRARGI